jgi:UPF0755 protein
LNLGIGRISRWVLPLVVLFTLASIGRNFIRQSWSGFGPLPATTAIVVPHADTAALAGLLEQRQVIDEPLIFRAAVFLTSKDGPLHAGEFSFPAHASLEQVLGVLRHGRQVEHHLTIPEGLTGLAIAALVNDAPVMRGHVSAPAEGSILPNTYDYLYDASRPVLMDRAEAALKAALDTAWAARAPNLPLASAREAVILASIVERETAKPDERPMVAAVYLNRLRQGMKLQADPTVIYGLSKGAGMLDRPLTHDDLADPDPYNTYVQPGLPPGPIAAPGLAAIDAVLHPADSDAFYFVADGTGGHVFSHDYAGQVRNIAKRKKATKPN